MRTIRLKEENTTAFRLPATSSVMREALTVQSVGNFMYVRQYQLSTEAVGLEILCRDKSVDFAWKIYIFVF